MGLSIESTRFLAAAAVSGVSFRRTLTLGRQQMMASPELLERILREHGFYPPPGEADVFRKTLASTEWRFEPFARALGAEEVVSCDASPYEGAALIHDLNQPIPEAWHAGYDVVIDGGTLEHVFNFPVAIASCMQWLKPGGHLILFTPANNYCGHGFYQFSPELFYRVLSPENGFQMLRMIALVDSMGVSSVAGIRYPFTISGRWHAVRDPAEIGRRVTLINRAPSILMVLARKVQSQELFRLVPQQSDFVTQWHEGSASDPLHQTGARERFVRWLRTRIPEQMLREWLPRFLGWLDPLRMVRFRREHSFANRTCYEPVDVKRTEPPRVASSTRSARDARHS